jgi:hypothetical protein
MGATEAPIRTAAGRSRNSANCVPGTFYLLAVAAFRGLRYRSANQSSASSSVSKRAISLPTTLTTPS